MTHETHGIRWVDDDVVNPDEYDSDVVRAPSLWLLHDHGYTIGLAFADNVGDALDILADDTEMLAPFEIAPDDFAEYGIGTDDEDAYATRLGNDCAPYDIEGVGFIKIDSPPLSIAALCNAVDADVNVNTITTEGN